MNISLKYITSVDPTWYSS